MTAAIRSLPNMASRADRIAARADEEHRADMRARAILRAKTVIRDPRGVSDVNLRTACGWFMALSIAEMGEDGLQDYQLADQHIAAINRRERIARNREAAWRLEPMVPREDDPPRWGKALAVLAGAGWLAVIVGWIVQEGWL